MVLQGKLGMRAQLGLVSGVSLEGAARRRCVWESGRHLRLECLPMSLLQQAQVGLSEMGLHVAQASLQFISQVPDYRHALSNPVYVTTRVEPRASRKPGQHSASGAMTPSLFFPLNRPEHAL